MQICQQHWDALREAIKSRGLWHLVSKDGQTAAENLAKDTDEGRISPERFDPLMQSFIMITAQAIEMFGLMTMNDGFCPVCYSVEYYVNKTGQTTKEEVENFWINGPSDGVLTYCQEHKLCPMTQ